MSEQKVIPNFLKHYTITELERQINDVHFPWHYPQTEGEPDQYVNLLYYDHQFSNAMNPMLMRCLPEQQWHTDWQLSTPNKTCVIYLNDNNGYTEFRDGKKILSVKNTAVIFDSNLEHRGVPSTDNRRLVLNINYFEK